MDALAPVTVRSLRKPLRKDKEWANHAKITDRIASANKRPDYLTYFEQYAFSYLTASLYDNSK